jgi:hypothetical protein
MAASVWAITQWCKPLGSLRIALVGSVTGSAVYLGMMGLISRQEIRTLVRALLRPRA